jgi:hypothetical protein
MAIPLGMGAGSSLRVVQLMGAATSGGAVDEEGGRCEVGRWVSKVGCFDGGVD